MKGKKRFYFKLLSLTIILSTFPVIIVGLFSYLKSAETIQTNIAKEKQQSVYQIQTNIEQVLKNVDLSVTNFITSYSLVKTLEEPLSPDQFQMFNQTKKEISKLQRFDVGMTDFLLVSTEKGWRINNNGLRRLNENEIEQLEQAYFSIPKKSAWILEDTEKIPFDSNEGNSCPYAFSLVKKLPFNTINKTGLAVSYIPICHFNDMLTKNLDSETIIILDESNNILAHSDYNQIGKPFMEEEVITNLMEVDHSDGQFNMTNDDGRFKITYRKSSYNNWTYLSMIEIKELNKESNAIGWFTFIICTIMLIGILFFAFFGSRRLYKPIGELAATLVKFDKDIPKNKKQDEIALIENQIHHMVEKNAQLESRLQGQIGQLKQYFVSRLLQGKIDKTEIPDKLTSYQYSDSWKQFFVMTIRIDSLQGTEFEDTNEDLLLFTINNLVEELIPKENRMTPVVLSKLQATICLQEKKLDATYIHTVTELVETLQEKVKDELGLSIGVGISNVYIDLSDAEKAFKESKEALRYTLNLGPESIIFFENLERESSFYTSFPRHIENKLFDAIKLGDKEAVDENLDQLMNELFDDSVSHTQYEIAIVRFLTDVIELTETLGIDVLEFEEHKSLFDQLYDFRTLNEVKNWFKHTIIYPVMNKVEKRAQSQYKNISDEIIHIIQQEFDSDLSLNYIAEKLHYNPNYLSTIFRKETNTSFSDYLALFRINKAKEWLVETDMTVKEIAEKLNYNNSQNFIRSFRKFEGTTPGRFRQSKRE